MDLLVQDLYDLRRSFFWGASGALGSHPQRAGVKEGEVFLPSMPLENLGDRSFTKDYGLRFPYVAGAMANGIASESLVKAMAENGMLGIFGSAGLSPSRVEGALKNLKKALGEKAFGANLIHSPSEPQLEEEIVDLYLKLGLSVVEASAFLDLTLPIVRYRLSGIYQDSHGKVCCPNRVIGKVSRIEVARKFMAPAPDKFLQILLQQGHLTPAQVQMAKKVPIAQDITAEADSGGHTDNRPSFALIPTILALSSEMQEKYQYKDPLRVGAAGGIGTPQAAASAFSMGAAYIVVGSVHQACVESGSSDVVRQMLAKAEQADIAMAPSADMFEMGVKVQVLKRGTMFAMRAGRLLELYRKYKDLSELPAKEKASLEKLYFKRSCEMEWQSTRAFFLARDPRQVERAEKDPRHLMALLFRSYLGQASRWANEGADDRVMDYQVWCGPAMGAFNQWVKGSFLESVENRKAATVALNLLYGAALCFRGQSLRSQGQMVPRQILAPRPRTAEEILSIVDERTIN